LQLIPPKYWQSFALGVTYAERKESAGLGLVGWNQRLFSFIFGLSPDHRADSSAIGVALCISFCISLYGSGAFSLRKPAAHALFITSAHAVSDSLSDALAGTLSFALEFAGPQTEPAPFSSPAAHAFFIATARAVS